MHITRCVQLTHSRINNRISCFSFLPSAQLFFIIYPINFFVFGSESIAYSDARKMLQDGRIEIAPNQFIQKSFVEFFGSARFFANRNSAKSEMNTESRSAVFIGRKIARSVVGFNNFLRHCARRNFNCAARKIHFF